MADPTDDPISIDLEKIGVKPTPIPERPPGALQGKPKAWNKPDAAMSYYKLVTVNGDQIQPDGRQNYRITKFNSALNVESSYFINYMPSGGGGYFDCQCPAAKFDCRHKAIMKSIIEAGNVNSDKFFCFEMRTFKDANEIS